MSRGHRRKLVKNIVGTEALYEGREWESLEALPPRTGSRGAVM